MILDDLFRVLLHVSRAFDGLSLRYAVGGSVASTQHGEPRLTNDVDILVELPESKRRALADSFSGAN